MKLSRTKKLFWLILGITLLTAVIDMPKVLPLKFRLGPLKIDHTLYRPDFAINLGSTQIKKSLDLKYGLDLAGGAQLVFEADTSKLKPGDIPDALNSLKDNIERRVNLFGVSEASVQLSHENNSNRLIVELPGVANVNDAIALIGQTAKLDFKGEVNLPKEATASATIYDLFAKDYGLTGGNLVKAAVTYDPNTSQPEVSLEFNADGAKKFATATKDMLGKRIAIFLDDQLISYPTVNSEIPDGKAVIQGNFDVKTAKALAAQLNAGALPVPIKMIQQTQVGATLGKDSITKGVTAGLVGLTIVAVFMVANYGILGLIADLGLLIYGLITLALYKLIPVTLTFPGIVGFILSIGMAVDGNILIFERFKEEIHRGRPWIQAMELGFTRAWNSIRDANGCTIITGLILFNPFNWSFLNSSGLVRGFAITLILGILIGLFTSIVVTRTFLRLFIANRKAQ
ncbi:protein translocase subunit SecD [Patescibacteria group bacterium]|nr:protein translocase subunit SecD [Patescibacteria group bacterium]